MITSIVDPVANHFAMMIFLEASGGTVELISNLIDYCISESES